MAGLPDLLRLVVILDAAAAGSRDLADIGARAVRGGATMLQVRGKGLPAAVLAGLVREVLAAAPSTCVTVNDRLDVALAVGAAGCHLGQDDLPVADARRMAPPGFILGGSAGTSDEARRAAAEGAHYLGIGPVRATTNKADAGGVIGVDGFRQVREAGGLPAVGIGGIGADDVAALMAAGASGIAVIDAVLGAPDPEQAARTLRGQVEAATDVRAAQA